MKRSPPYIQQPEDLAKWRTKKLLWMGAWTGVSDEQGPSTDHQGLCRENMKKPNRGRSGGSDDGAVQHQPSLWALLLLQESRQQKRSRVGG